MLVAGIDEVGRGCLVGPVMAAAVILDPEQPILGLTDSKKLTPQRRFELSVLIKASAISWSVARVEASEIDRINIFQASLLAMVRAFNGLSVIPDRVLVDGNRYPAIACAGEAIIKGDLLIPAISAASILAKVARDKEMSLLDDLYPGYEFAQHKGYPTVLHKQKIQLLGLTPLHRQSFAPIKNWAATVKA